MKRFCAIILTFAVLPAFSMDLSFDSAVEKIISKSHDYKKADANLKKAKAALDLANASRWPKIQASATYMNLLNVENPGKPFILPIPNMALEMPDNIMMAGASISVPIYTFGKIGYAVENARSAIKMSLAGKELAAREVKYAAAQLYWTAKMTDGIVEVYEKSLNVALDAKRKLTAAGRASRANLVKIESDIESKKINLSDARFNRDAAYRMLKIMAGLDEDIVLTSEFPAADAEINGSIENNPEWDMLSEQVRMNEAAAFGKRAEHYPTLAATGNYNYLRFGNDVSGMWGEKNYPASQSAYWGLSLQVPIFDGGLARANATMAVQDAAAAREGLEKSKKLATEEFNTAVLRLAHLRNNLSGLKKARDLAEKAYGFSRDRFAAGQASAVELSDVSNSLTQLDVAVLNAKYNIAMTGEQIIKLK